MEITESGIPLQMEWPTPRVDALAAFVERVASDGDLRSRLSTLGTDHVRFAETCVEAGRELGLVITAEQVGEFLRARHLYWLQRHIS